MVWLTKMHKVTVRKYDRQTGELLNKDIQEFLSIYNANKFMMDIRVRQEAINSRFKYEMELRWVIFHMMILPIC